MRRLLCRLLSFVRSNRAEAELSRELAAHLRLLEDDFAARGMGPEAARLAARRAFGGQVEQMRARHRDARSFRWLDESWLDLKLGVRMLAKYPGLTAIAIVALAVAIGGGAAYLEFLHDLVSPTLPVRGGERIVGIHHLDAATGNAQPRALHDFAIWRDRLRSVDELGAYTGLERNLITDDGRTEPVDGVEISASAFRLITAAPLLGRPLLAEDERPGAPPVLVIGERLWRSRFDADPGVIGRPVQLGADTHTIVGVMPESFGFPVNHHLSVPLRLNGAGVPPGGGPPIVVFGRLAPDVAIETAQAELDAVARASAEDARTPQEQRLQPQIKPFVDALWASVRSGRAQVLILYSVNLFFVALLGVCGANVATLVFARTATRESEIAVRTALGASRGRIVAQLFAEAVVLALAAAGVGLAAASFGLEWGKATWLKGAGEGAAAPFWWDDRLSPSTYLYAGALSLIAAVIVGVVPALKATGTELQGRLKLAAAGGAAKFGGMWTGIIVAQIALTVIFLLSIASVGWHLYESGYTTADTTFTRSQYLSTRLELDPANVASGTSSDRAEAGFGKRLRSTTRELERRLLAEPGVGGATFATAFPGMKHGEFFVEFDLAAAPELAASVHVPASGPLWVRTASVDESYFESFGAPIVAGRGFAAGDVELNRPVAVVDQAFVQHLLNGRVPIGLRVHQPQNSENDKPGPWYEIVGVVADLSTKPRKTSEDAVIYLPGPAAAPIHVAVHVEGDARAFIPRLRSLAAATDPTLRLHDFMRLDQVDEADRIVFGFFFRALAIVSAVALILSTAGVYALLSFTVTRRTREIGIRAAVGADQRRILTGIFSRAFGQVGTGIAAGSVPGMLLVAMGAPEVASGSGFAVALGAFTVVAAFMFGVTMLACVVPARRALRIQPTDALRADA